MKQHIDQDNVKSIKLVPIGNSKGIRIPKPLIQKYGFSHNLLLEETEQGLLLRAQKDEKLSWEDTFKDMANEKEDWSDFDIAVFDGLDSDEF